MTKFIVLLVGIIWACLLFISWGQADGIVPPPVETGQNQQN
ncbi:hypothetical protein [Geoalkalibacter halelectricus]|nr:hypothetical protein [Geoalkalibacter halelectricus]